MTADARLLAESLASRYRIDRELGRGGMATVYLAEDIRHRRNVAIKVLHAELSAVLGHERFLKEIQVTAGLQHPNILPLFDSGNADGQLFYVMPFVEGESLRERMTRGPLAIGEATAILRDVAKALGAAHSRGVVHRDIKPDNILLSGDTAVVADFGISKAIDLSRTDAGVDITETGVSLGTPAYMAPEQALGDPVDARSDIYAWALIAYETLSGAHPFVGKTTAQQIIAAQIAEQPKPIAPRAGLPAAVAELVTRCLAKSPAERPESAGELIRSLDAAMSSSASVPVPQPPAISARRWMPAIGGLVLVAALAAGWLLRRNTTPNAAAGLAAAAASPSLVVLPFANIGGVAENEIFADGVTEDVITHLATIGGLTVISRTSAMTYKGTTKALKQIAAELGVGAVLEGSVRRIGSRVRVVAQLIDAKTDAHKWAGTFDRELADVFAIQSEIAATIADTLKATLSPESRQRMAARPTSDTLAYQLYLQGRAMLRVPTAPNLTRGIALFQQAIQRDSNFALAYQGLAGSYSALSLQEATPARSSLAKARAAVDHALSLDPSLPLGHATRGYVLMFAEYDWPQAERELQRAVADAPNEPSVRSQYAGFLVIVGRANEAVRQARVGVTLDPQSPNAMANLAGMLLGARQYDEGLVVARRATAAEPKNQIAWTQRWYMAWWSNQMDEAFDALIGLQDAAGIHFVTKAELSRAFAAGGKPGVLHLLIAQWPESYRPIHRALWYAELGDRDHAMEWLERGYGERWIALPYVLRWPAFDSMKNDPRFVAFIRKIGLSPSR